MPDKRFDLILRGARVLTESGGAGGEPVDVAISRGKIAAIEPRLNSTAAREIDLGGMLLTPPFIESHIHLDSALIDAGQCLNKSGTLFEGIDIWRELKKGLTFDNVVERATQTLKLQADQGVLFVRTHADVSEEKLIALKALLKVRDTVKDWMTVQVVAFPQDGLYGSPQQLKRMETALKLDVDVVGGIPHYELTREDGVNSVHEIFKLSRKYDRMIDVHCDEIDDGQSRFLEVMAACAIRSGWGERTTASHTTAFGSYENAYATKLMSVIKRSKINIVANPLINMVLQGRADTYPKRRGLTRVKELWQIGVNVSLGYDCIMDPWYALGTGNMLDAAHMAVHTCQMMGRDEIDACYNMVTWNAARTLGVEDHYGIAVGKPANLVALEVKDKFDAIRLRPRPVLVLSRGKIISQRL
jgi:cytosine deaminase